MDIIVGQIDVFFVVIGFVYLALRELLFQFIGTTLIRYVDDALNTQKESDNLGSFMLNFVKFLAVILIIGMYVLGWPYFLIQDLHDIDQFFKK